MARDICRRALLGSGATVLAFATAGCVGGDTADGTDRADGTDTQTPGADTGGTDSGGPGETSSSEATDTPGGPASFPPVTVDESYRMFQADAGNTGATGTTGPGGEVARRWHFETEGKVFRTPLVAEGTVLAVDQNGRTFGLDPADGTERWRVEFDSGPDATPAVADGALLISDGGDRLVALDVETGDERWSYEADGGLTARPAVADGTAYVAGGLAVHAVDVADGSPVWTFEHENGHPLGDVAVGDGAVFVAMRRSQAPAGLTAIEATDGSERWTVRFEDPTTVPTVSDGTVYLASDDSLTEVYALDAASGETLRSRRTEGAVETSPVVAPSPAADELRAVFADQTGRVYALDDSDWERPAWGGQASYDGADLFFQESPTMADGAIYFADDETLAAIDFESGDPLWGTEVSAAVTTGVAVAGGMLFTGSYDGVYGYQAPA